MQHLSSVLKTLLASFCIFLLSTPTLTAQRQDFFFDKFTTTEGLPEEFAAHVLQDEQGYIWVGTQNGVARYDGYTFKSFGVNHNGGENCGAELRNVRRGMMLGKDGKIWFSSYSSDAKLVVYDPKEDCFTNYYQDEQDSTKLNLEHLFLLHEDAFGNLWCANFEQGGVNGPTVVLCRLDQSTGIFHKYEHDFQFRSPAHRRIIGNQFLVESEADQGLWHVDGQKQLARWNPELNQFERLSAQRKKEIGVLDSILAIYPTQRGHLILKNQDTVQVFDPVEKQITHRFFHQPGAANSLSAGSMAGWNLYEYSPGKLWVHLSGGKINLIDLETNKIQNLEIGKGALQFDFKPGFKLQGMAFTDLDKHNIWYRIQVDGVRYYLQYRIQEGTFHLFDATFDGEIEDYGSWYSGGTLLDRTGLLWGGGRPNLSKQNVLKSRIKAYNADENNPASIASDTIGNLFCDRKNRVWVMGPQGLSLYHREQDRFKTFEFPALPVPESGPIRALNIYEAPDQQIWLGKRGGIWRYNESTQAFESFYKTSPQVLISNLTQEEDGDLWGLSYDFSNNGESSLIAWDSKNGSIKKRIPPSVLNLGGRYKLLKKDADGNIWIAPRYIGVARYNIQQDTVYQYPAHAKFNSFTGFFTDQEGGFWVMAELGYGLHKYNPAQDSFRSYAKYAYSNAYLALDSLIYLATYASGGLVELNTRTMQESNYGVAEGLLHLDSRFRVSNRSLEIDDLGNIYLPNSLGLSLFNVHSKSFQNYSSIQGFNISAGFGYYVSEKDLDGNIWIGGDNGLNKINPSELMAKDSTLPQVWITSMGIMDTIYSRPDGELFTQSVSFTKEVTLSHQQKDLSFSFVGLHYLEPSLNQYRWKLENYDQQFSTPSTSRTANYTNLSPGTYTFRVKASNADGVWNEAGASIKVIILPPWWQTWWARILFLLTIAGGIVLYIRWRTNRLRRVNELLEQKVQLRTEKLKESYEDLKSTQDQLIHSEKMASLGELTAGIAHEIKNPLNFVNNFSEVTTELVDELNDEINNGDLEEVKSISKDIKQNLEKIKHHGTRADNIVKSMLEHSRTSTGEKVLTDLNALAEEYLNLAYHGYRAKNPKLNPEIISFFDPKLPTVMLTPQDIGRVLLNLVNNALYAVSQKASEQTDQGYKPTVTVTTKVGKPMEEAGSEMVQIIVSDNGLGIPEEIKEKIFQPFFTTKPTGQGTGLGLSLSYDIIKAHGGELSVESIEGESTTFKLLLPSAD